jgi:hypothetical protein
MSAGLDRFAEEVDAPMAPRIVPMVPTMQLGRWEGGRTSVVHRLQRERGVTCGWVASGGRLFTALLQPARDSTDLTQPTAPITAVVARIRSDADAAVAAVAAAEQQGDTAAAEAARAGMAIAFYDIFRRWNRLLQRALDASADEVVAAARIAPAIGAQTEEASADSPNGREELPIPAELRPQAELSPPAFDGGSPLDPSSQTAFAAFAHLKEATGIERAFLCGALALPEAALPRLPTRAFADLVIGMQQQRAYEDRVKRVAPPRLLELLNAGFVLEPELRELQVGGGGTRVLFLSGHRPNNIRRIPPTSPPSSTPPFSTLERTLPPRTTTQHPPTPALTHSFHTHMNTGMRAHHAHATRTACTCTILTTHNPYFCVRTACSSTSTSPPCAAPSPPKPAGP